jgi:putative glycosyltransferase (TIGR04348 family)
MHALLVTPAPEGSLAGNRWTAERWAERLARLGHGSEIVQEFRDEDCDLMIGLHARRSAESIARFHSARPDAPLLVALTGTDLYDDLEHSPAARRSVELATRLIALHRLAGQGLDEELRPKLRVILQSAEPVRDVPPPVSDAFEICVLGHLRPVKDPFRAAEAARLLPADSRVRVLHVGTALEAPMEERARREQAENPRYRWLGPLPRDEARRVLARSRLLVLSSLMEGGANVVGEAAVQGVPVVASRIPGSMGLLGVDYPGYFATGDTAGLADMIRRCESDPSFYDELRARCCSLARDFSPDAERDAWRSLLAELFPN